ncbi:MAG: hypothetical protein ABWZ98_10375 [Nakamurella sp.]
MPELPESVSDATASAAVRRRGSSRVSSPLARWGFAIFVIGLLAVAAIMVLFATGSHDLPLWLNLAAMLAPIGFGIGLLGVFLESRSAGAKARAAVTGQPGLTPTSTN